MKNILQGWVSTLRNDFLIWASRWFTCTEANMGQNDRNSQCHKKGKTQADELNEWCLENAYILQYCVNLNSSSSSHEEKI